MFEDFFKVECAEGPEELQKIIKHGKNIEKYLCLCCCVAIIPLLLLGLIPGGSNPNFGYLEPSLIIH